jgi:hypothetical protein
MRHLWLVIIGALAWLVAGHAAFAAQRCTMTGAVKRCESSFGPGKIVTFGESSGDVNKMVIDDPNTSVDPEKLAVIVGLTMAKFSPKLTADDRGEAFKKLLAIGAKQSKEQVRLGDWTWGAVWIDKHLTLTLQKRAP